MASVQQQTIIAGLRIIRRKKLWQDPERLLQDAREQQRDWPPNPPEKITQRVQIQTDESRGFPVFTFQPKSGGSSPRRQALYIHGGGYIHAMGAAHFKLIATLVERAGLTVVAPCYPLAPDQGWRDSFDAVVDLARQQDGPGTPLLMGDSAGAGYALAVTEILASEGRRPRAVLISPYGDAFASDPRTAKYDARDPYLAAVGVRTALQAWAGDDDPKRPEISPLFGSFAEIERMLIFTGTRDTIHPQAHQIYDKAQADGVDCRLVIEDGCIHVYPLMPIPEARRAIDMIVDFVTDDSNSREHPDV